MRDLTIRRELDGVFFRIKTENGYENICFSDLTEEQQDEVMDGKNEQWLKSMCKILASCLRDIGDELNMVCER